MEDQYGTEEGKPANFLVLDASLPFEAVRQRARRAGMDSPWRIPVQTPGAEL